MWKCNWEFVGEKCEHFFRRNVCIWFRVSSTFGQSDGACPTHRRQWADFLAALTALPRRHDKTARTETRCHLLLKLRQVTTQTSASRGYVLFRGANKGHTRKSYKLSPGCGHDPRSAPNLERHGSSQMQTSGWLEMPHFLNRISTCISIWNPTVRSSHNITYHSQRGLCFVRQFLSCKYGFT